MILGKKFNIYDYFPQMFNFQAHSEAYLSRASENYEHLLSGYNAETEYILYPLLSRHRKKKTLHFIEELFRKFC